MSEASELVLDDLHGMAEKDFGELIGSHLGSEHAGLWELLLDPSLVERTRNVLSGKYSELVSLMGSRKAELEAYQQKCFKRGREGRQDYFAARGEYQAWKSRTLGYKRLLEVRMSEAKAAGVAAYKATHGKGEARKQSAVSAVVELGRAIVRHRRASREADIRPELHDEELWQALERIEFQTASGGISVAKLLKDISVRQAEEDLAAVSEG